MGNALPFTRSQLQRDDNYIKSKFYRSFYFRSIIEGYIEGSKPDILALRLIRSQRPSSILLMNSLNVLPQILQLILHFTHSLFRVTMGIGHV